MGESISEGRSRPAAGTAVPAREKWDFEKEIRLRELDLRVAEMRRSRWGNPLVIAVFTAAAAGAANLAVSFLNAQKQAEIESLRAESALVLAAIRTENGDVKTSQVNLNFLAKTGLLSPKLAEKVAKSLETGPTPSIVAAAVGGTTSGGSVDIPAAGPQGYNFPVLNKSAIERAGWDVDVFSCAASGPGWNAARAFAESLASAADGKSGLAGQQLGRIRLTAGKSWTTANVVSFDANESTIADALVDKARFSSGKPFAKIPNTGSSTMSYVSVFFCGSE
ncbi:MAG TPA: hypothetical protein VF620_04975 [Allosphingosinicella sp.]|jgi:hypothetical protein